MMTSPLSVGAVVESSEGSEGSTISVAVGSCGRGDLPSVGVCPAEVVGAGRDDLLSVAPGLAAAELLPLSLGLVVAPGSPDLF